MKNGGLILRNAIALCEMSKTSWQMGKLFLQFVEPLKSSVILHGAKVEYCSISARDQSKLRQFGKNVLPRMFLGYALFAREFGKEIIWLQTLKN